MAALRLSYVTTELIKRRLSAPDASHTRIARELGVHRTTVWRIAKAMRTQPPRLTRCADCGAMVVSPCRACTLRDSFEV